MTVKMQELCNKRAELQNKGNSLVAENKLEELEAVNNEIANIDNQISMLEKFEASAKASIETTPVANENKKFKNLSEQLRAIKNAAYAEKRGDTASIDKRLVRNDLSGGLNTGNDADGGYAIQSDFIGAILDKRLKEAKS